MVPLFLNLQPKVIVLLARNSFTRVQFLLYYRSKYSVHMATSHLLSCFDECSCLTIHLLFLGPQQILIPIIPVITFNYLLNLHPKCHLSVKYLVHIPSSILPILSLFLSLLTYVSLSDCHRGSLGSQKALSWSHFCFCVSCC